MLDKDISVGGIEHSLQLHLHSSTYKQLGYMFHDSLPNSSTALVWDFTQRTLVAVQEEYSWTL